MNDSGRRVPTSTRGIGAAAEVVSLTSVPPALLVRETFASAVEAVGGDMSDMDAVRAAVKAAKFDSVRGDFKFGTNNMPVQDFYLREVVEDADGTWTTKVISTVYENHQDTYASECKM